MKEACLKEFLPKSSPSEFRQEKDQKIPRPLDLLKNLEISIPNTSILSADRTKTPESLSRSPLVRRDSDVKVKMQYYFPKTTREKRSMLDVGPEGRCYEDLYEQSFSYSASNPARMVLNPEAQREKEITKVSQWTTNDSVFQFLPQRKFGDLKLGELNREDLQDGLLKEQIQNSVRNAQSSQAYAGAMKALQEKIKEMEEHAKKQEDQTKKMEDLARKQEEYIKKLETENALLRTKQIEKIEKIVEVAESEEGGRNEDDMISNKSLQLNFSILEDENMELRKLKKDAEDRYEFLKQENEKLIYEKAKLNKKVNSAVLSQKEQQKIIEERDRLLEEVKGLREDVKASRKQKEGLEGETVGLKKENLAILEKMGAMQKEIASNKKIYIQHLQLLTMENEGLKNEKVEIQRYYEKEIVEFKEEFASFQEENTLKVQEYEQALAALWKNKKELKELITLKNKEIKNLRSKLRDTDRLPTTQGDLSPLNTSNYSNLNFSRVLTPQKLDLSETQSLRYGGSGTPVANTNSTIKKFKLDSDYFSSTGTLQPQAFQQTTKRPSELLQFFAELNQSFDQESLHRSSHALNLDPTGVTQLFEKGNESMNYGKSKTNDLFELMMSGKKGGQPSSPLFSGGGSPFTSPPTSARVREVRPDQGQNSAGLEKGDEVIEETSFDYYDLNTSNGGSLGKESIKTRDLFDSAKKFHRNPQVHFSFGGGFRGSDEANSKKNSVGDDTKIKAKEEEVQEKVTEVQVEQN